MKTLKRTWADISLDNLEYNYRSIRAHLPSGTRFLGVMKADAYGHGAVPVSRALADLGAEYLAVPRSMTSQYFAAIACFSAQVSRRPDKYRALLSPATRKNTH